MGYSSPVIVAGNVYLSDAELKKPLVRERVHCLEAASGKVRWTYSYEHSVPDWFFMEGQGRGPGATPIVVNGKVYALDLFGNLVCLDTTHGKVIWKNNLKEESQMKETSVDASPLIEGDLLILMLGGKEGAGIVSRRILSDTSTGLLLGDYVYSAKTGGDFLCLKAATGEEIWKTSTVTDLINGASIHVTVHGDSAFLF